MDIQALLAQLGNGGGGITAPRPMMLNPSAAMSALPQMPKPMQPGPQAPNQSAQLAAQALAPPPPQQQQDPMGGMGDMLKMASMQSAMGGTNPLKDLLGLTKPATATATIPANGGLPASQTFISMPAPDFGGQSTGIHGLWHRLFG